MKNNLIIFLALCFVFSGIAHAGVSEMPGPALEHWLKKQNKFSGAIVEVRESEDNSFNVTRWEVQGVPKPTDAELQQIINEFKSDESQEKLDRKTRKKAVLQKMGLQKSDITALVELIKDGSDE